MVKAEAASLVRVIVFGVEDSLVSTVGFLSGIVAGGMARPQIMLTGIVLLFVEAFSMAIGSMVAEESAEEYLQKQEAPFKQELFKGLVMFASYFFSGFIPLGPYYFIESQRALFLSVGMTFFALFLLGYLGGKFLHINVTRNTLRTMILGGTAICVGAAAAILFKV